MRPARCEVPSCDGAHVKRGLCHYCDGSYHAKGLCSPHYKRSRYTRSQRTLPRRHVLMPDEVREIRRLYARGFFQREIAEQYAVSSAAVSMIVHRKTWKDLAD